MKNLKILFLLITLHAPFLNANDSLPTLGGNGDTMIDMFIESSDSRVQEKINEVRNKEKIVHSDYKDILNLLKVEIKNIEEVINNFQPNEVQRREMQDKLSAFKIQKAQQFEDLINEYKISNYNDKKLREAKKEFMKKIEKSILEGTKEIMSENRKNTDCFGFGQIIDGKIYYPETCTDANGVVYYKVKELGNSLITQLQNQINAVGKINSQGETFCTKNPNHALCKDPNLGENNVNSNAGINEEGLADDSGFEKSDDLIRNPSTSSEDPCERFREKKNHAPTSQRIGMKDITDRFSSSNRDLERCEVLEKQREEEENQRSTEMDQRNI